MRGEIGGTLVRAIGWAISASLSALVVAVAVGVGGFELLAHQGEVSSVRIVRAIRPAALIEAVQRAEQPRASNVATTVATPFVTSDDDLVPLKGARAAAAGFAAAATVTATAAATPEVLAARAVPPTADSAVQTTARELRIATPPLVPGQRVQVSVSFYYCQDGLANHPGDGGGFCGVMRDGSRVYPGAAACAVEYLGQLFSVVGDPTPRIYKCADTGSAVGGLHRDIWFDVSDDGWAWQRSVGRVAVIEILP